MHRLKILGAIALAACGLSSCANTEELLSQRERELNEAQARIDGLEREVGQLESQRLAADKAADSERDRADGLDRERERLAGRVDELEGEVASLNSKAEESSKIDGLDVRPLANGDILLTLDSSVTFASGSIEITAAGRGILRGAVMEWVRRHPSHLVSLEGHTDDQRLGGIKEVYGNNLNLSIARANAVCAFLRDNGLVRENRMRVVGYGPHRPKVPNAGPEGRAINRRVEIVLLKQET